MTGLCLHVLTVLLLLFLNVQGVSKDGLTKDASTFGQVTAGQEYMAESQTLAYQVYPVPVAHLLYGQHHTLLSQTQQ